MNSLFANLSRTYWDFDIAQIEILFSVLIFAATTILGAVIFSRDTKSWTNRFFIFLAIVFDGYIVANYFSLHPPGFEFSDRLFWIRMVMFTASFKAPLLFLLVYNFPRKELVIPTKHLITVLTIMFLTATVSLGPFVFSGLSYDNLQPNPVPGSGMILFILNFGGFLFLSFFTLIRGYRNAQGIEKIQRFYFLAGVVVSFSLILIFILFFVVVLNMSSFVFLGPLFLLFLLGSIAYSIVKHKLFNVKVVATNVLVITVLIILFSKVFAVESLIGIIIDAIVFMLVLIFGVLLIKSVGREVEQREKLEKLTKELESTNKKLKELDHLKSQFLSFASHQIKTPLAAIKGFASLICDGSYGECPPKINETSKKISEAANRMISLVNEFLDLRKIEEGRMDYVFEKIDGVKMVGGVVEELKLLAQAKKLDLTFEPEIESVQINADTQRLRQVFQNLIENAIKYTDPRSAVGRTESASGETKSAEGSGQLRPSDSVASEASNGFVKVNIKSADGSFMFSVVDSGHGIEKELLPELFEEFRRAGNSDTKRIEGTGLGLFIAKQIVLGHKGEIWAESDGPGKGSKFFVKVPLV